MRAHFASSGRGQASLELLLLLAALFAFLAVLVPSINSGRELVDHAQVAQEEKSAFNRLWEAASKASVLGAGTSFSIDFVLPAEQTEIAFNEKSFLLSMRTKEGNRTLESNKTLAFPIILKYNPWVLEKGQYSAKVSAVAGGVSFYFNQNCLVSYCK